MHREDPVFAPSPSLDVQHDQAAARDVARHHGVGHAAPSEPAEQERVFGAEVAEPPSFGRQHAEILSPRQVGAVRQHELHVVA